MAWKKCSLAKGSLRKPHDLYEASNPTTAPRSGAQKALGPNCFQLPVFRGSRQGAPATGERFTQRWLFSLVPGPRSTST